MVGQELAPFFLKQGGVKRGQQPACSQRPRQAGVWGGLTPQEIFNYSRLMLNMFVDRPLLGDPVSSKARVAQLSSEGGAAVEAAQRQIVDELVSINSGSSKMVNRNMVLKYS